MHWFAFLPLLCLPLYQAIASATFVSPHVKRNLVPFRHTNLATCKNFDSAANASQFVPQDFAKLYYSHDSPNAPTVSLTFTAYPGQPILALQDINEHLSSVSCTHDGDFVQSEQNFLNIRFLHDDAFRSALYTWKKGSYFNIITSHTTCNLKGEHGAWSVISISGDESTRKIVLQVQPVPLKSVGQSFRVKFAQGSIDSWTSNQNLQSRSMEFNSQNNFDYTGQQIFPGNSTAGNAISSELLQALQNAGVEVNCVNCFSRTNFNLDLDFEFSSLSITAASVVLTVEQFDQELELEVSTNQPISASPSFDMITIPILPGWNIPNICTIGPSIGLSLGFNIEMSAGLNVTFGANASIPHGATASINLLDSTAGHLTGWDASTVAQKVPFRLNSGNFNMSAGISLSPFVQIDVSVLDKVVLNSRITQNAPLLSLGSTAVSSVNRQCQPVGDNDFESFGIAYILDSGMSLTTLASVDLLDDVPAISGFASWSATLAQENLPFLNDANTCFIVADDSFNSVNRRKADQKSSSLSSLIPASTGTLVPATSAVPTFDIPKIESYYSAQGHLPTNVNYNQLVQVTSVPSDIQNAVNNIVKSNHGIFNQEISFLKIALWVFFFIGATHTI